MNTKQIWQALTNDVNTEKYFDGVFSYDTLKNIKQRPRLIVCNTDPSYKKGEHWILFFFNSDNSVDFFDSLGNEPSYYGDEFVKIIAKFSNYYYVGNNPIQSVNSNLCGFYCLWYAYWKCKNKLKMEKLINKIPKNKLVKPFVEKVFHYCKMSDCKLLQINV